MVFFWLSKISSIQFAHTWKNTLVNYFSTHLCTQDALLDYRMEAPYVPEEKDPDHYSSSDMNEGEVEGFASDFL